MKTYFRTCIFLTVLVLMIIGVGQPRSRAALDKPSYDPACLAACQHRNFQCFLGAVKKSDQHKCTAEYRNCITQCKQ